MNTSKFDMTGKGLLPLFFLFCCNACAADDGFAVGKITKISGSVYIDSPSSIQSKLIKSIPEGIGNNFRVRTKEKSQCFVTLKDGSRVALDENSVATFESAQSINNEAGLILYSIKKQEKMGGLAVKTNSAVIGVKGTRFIVEGIDGKLNVYLKEGGLEVSAVKGEFKKFKEELQAEFNAYKKKSDDEYRKYIAEMKGEYYEFTKKFDMPANTSISISDSNTVDKIETPDYINEKFKELGGD